ncbi:hypothetical protein [Actinomadura sp. HBU206391]|uniref:hypothetical protein n=1 Tax=Actinomadura sp. HBU206391 TaxID=2731692 RepID=UPI00165029CC|nr:hypothetical protein [Actinomadura sp. HBU206391]MBC6458141.1 hypothetical protein [Actinomadura sp. HBU206391]
MSNGARHTIGAVVGLIATPLLAVALFFGAERSLRFFRYYALDDASRWTGGAAILFAAVVLGLVAGSRVSPLASLIPGAVYFTVGALWVLAPRFTLEHTSRKLPDTLDRGYSVFGSYGMILLLGGLLVAASLPPSRWAARTPRPAPRPGGGPPYEFGGMAPPYGQVPGAGRPSGPGQSPHPGQPSGMNQPPPGMGQPGTSGPSGPPERSAGQSPAPYPPGPGAPPPAYSPPAYSPPPPPHSEQRPPARKSEDEGGGDAGSWTQMYGTGGSGKDDQNS